MIKKKQLMPARFLILLVSDLTISGSLGVGLGKDYVKIEYVKIFTRNFS